MKGWLADRLSASRQAASSWRSRWREALAEPGFGWSLVVSVALFLAGWIVNVYAIRFATERASNPVTDIVLSNIPVFDTDGFFVYGTLAFALFACLVILPHPRRIPFVLKSVALFWVIRSGFTSLTHIAPFTSEAVSDFGPRINHLFFGADRFFSAHAGMTFLGALGFWHRKWIRYIFLAGSVFFAVVVLLGHLHYSIDVAAAFFITYGIFDLAKWLFAADCKRFFEDLQRRTQV